MAGNKTISFSVNEVRFVVECLRASYELAYYNCHFLLAPDVPYSKVLIIHNYIATRP